MTNVPKEKLIWMYKTMLKIRQFEEKVHLLFLQGDMPGTIHLYQGQEAVAAGVCANLKSDDVVTSTHRPHGHAIAKGVSIKSLMAELFARSTGCCRGRGGSMHVGDPDVGMIPAIAIVGGGIPVATGIALAFKFQKSKRVAISFFGDGACNEGSFHESLNMGAIWNLPVIYVCENNLYAASTPVRMVVKIKDLAERASSYAIPGVVVDGNDAISVYEAATRAIEKARGGQGPTLIECKTYRRCGHSRSNAGNYRDKEEERIWLARDPIVILRERLIREGVLLSGDSKQMEEEIAKEIAQAVDFAKNSPWPKPEDALEDAWV
jgi:pyruvate dehydrogenase E1 component alpha subunit